MALLGANGGYRLWTRGIGGSLGALACMLACDLTPEQPSAEKLSPIEECSTVTASGNRELDAAYAEVRAMHFYRYGNEHPYCEATSHIMAHKGVVGHGLALRKLKIALRDPYRSACGREPEFAWHTVAALPSSDVGGGYLVLDPVYRCGIDSLTEYLRWYVRTDCPDFSGEFKGCVFMTEEQWLVDRLGTPDAMCLVVDIEPWHYDMTNCGSYDLGEPWDEARLARAYSYVRTDLNGTIDYSSRPGASMSDWGCDFGGTGGVFVSGSP